MEPMTRNWEDRRSPTLKDVAREVGVSEATASVVLNGARSGTRVSAATRQAVVDAAAAIGYRPNSVARALQAGRNHRIGLYSGRSEIDARNLFFSEILGGMCEAAHAIGSNVMLHTSGDEPERLVELVSGAALDGLVVHAGSDDPIIPLLAGLRAPAVAVGDPIPSLPSIVVDDRLGAQLQAQHLYDLGHRHVLFLLARHPVASALERLGAFQMAAKGMGVRTTVRYEETFARPLDASDLATVLVGRDRATAVVAWNDRVAELACVALDAAGMKIPEDVAVVGFDGFRSHSAPRYALTTVRAPWARVGSTAVELLSALVRGEEVPLLITLPVEFVPGGTTQFQRRNPS